MSELLPCPFCGGNAELISRGNELTKSRSTEVRCSQCFFGKTVAAIRQTLAWTREKAVAAWNRRTPSPAPVILTYPNPSETRMTPTAAGLTEEWRTRAHDALATIASVADVLNQELRENGPIDVRQFGMSMEIRDGIRLLVDLVREKERRLLTPKPLPENVKEALAFAEQKPGGQGVKTGLLMKRGYSPQTGALNILAAFIRKTSGETLTPCCVCPDSHYPECPRFKP